MSITPMQRVVLSWVDFFAENWVSTLLFANFKY